MLVLSRKKNECVTIGENVTVTVVEIRSEKVRLGFATPDWGSIHLSEFHERFMAQRVASPAPPVPPTPVAESRIEEPTPSPNQITLTEQQIALIDRFRTVIREATGTEPSRADAIATLFQAFENAEHNLTRFLFETSRGRRNLG